MKKLLISLFIVALIWGCETQQEKKERLLREKVLNSEYLNERIKEFLVLEVKSKLMKEGLGSERELQYAYNHSLGRVIGWSENTDTIIKRIDRNSELFKDYQVASAFYVFAKDSVLSLRYKKERDSIARLMH